MASIPVNMRMQMDGGNGSGLTGDITVGPMTVPKPQRELLTISDIVGSIKEDISRLKTTMDQLPPHPDGKYSQWPHLPLSGVRPQSSLARFHNSVIRVEKKFTMNTGPNNPRNYPGTERKKNKSVTLISNCKIIVTSDPLVSPDHPTPTDRIKMLSKPQKIILTE